MRKLSTASKAAYSAPAFALAVVGIPVYVYIPKFYTDVVGVHISALGAILLIVRLFDAFTDPVIGIFSDRLNTPMGRRRPLIAAGGVLTVFAIALLFNPPGAMGAHSAGLYFMALIFALFLFWTVVIVPYESLGPELTFDYNERTALFSTRDGALIAGTVIAAAMPGAVRWAAGLDSSPAGERQTFFILSLIYIPLILGACTWCVAAFRERPRAAVRSDLRIVAWIRASLANRPFRILLIAYTISAIGNNLPATLILYYVEYVLGSPRADLFLALYFVTGIVFLPMWVYLARRTGKKAAWIASMAINTGAFFWVFFLGAGDETLYGILVFLSGIGFGATLAIPSAIQADVIDYDELLAGERREGLYISLWSIAKKLAAAAGVGFGLALLGGSGYRPGVVQSDSVVLTLRVLYALVPCLCNALAIVIALYYPISGEIHRQIRGAIGERAAGRAVEDPLVPGRIIGQAGAGRG
ncbi:MAG: MFS transporter [Desulfobacterales bacterium]|nr:MFS transporter [Desulfobacterales bacterium]